MTARHLALLLLLTACGSSFELADADAAAAPDGGGLRDAGARGPDAGLAEDGGRSDGGALPSCVLEPVGETFGEPCFCRGPVVFAGGHLYHQSIGVDVYRVEDGDPPVEVGHVEERASASGGLVLAAGHLVSLVDFVDEPLRVYALDDPARPREVARLDVAVPPGERLLAAWGDRVFVGSRDLEAGRSALVAVDLARPDRPVARDPISFEGALRGLAPGPSGLAVLLERGTPERPETELRWLDADGTARGSRSLPGRAFPRALALTEDALLVGGGDGVLLERFRLDGTLAPWGALAHEGEWSPGGAVLVRGDRALVAGLAALVHLGPTLRVLGEGETMPGDVGAAAAPGGPFERVWLGAGGGVRPWRVRC
ncbi:MAG: hypothetical protein CMH59_24595, partial [Myxococcales bacterium]|nr:hypothetical protein [Myxococcales bacterium]